MIWSLTNILIILSAIFFLSMVVFQVYQNRKSPSEPEETEEEIMVEESEGMI